MNWVSAAIAGLTVMAVLTLLQSVIKGLAENSRLLQKIHDELRLQRRD